MRLVRSHTLFVLLRRGARGPVLAVESVGLRDLEDCLAEAWFEACLRRGAPEVPFDEVEAELHPLAREDEGGLVGFSLEVRGHHSVFTLLALEHVARRAELELRGSGTLATCERLYFELVAEPVDVQPDAESRPGRAEPVELLERELPCGPEENRAAGARVAGGDYPVFYTHAAHERAERIARKGAAASPPIETGGVLVGPLCRCPRTGEVFAVVEDVLAATEADEREYSLTFSGATWARIQDRMRARRADPATSHQRILGQTHGHSFPPLAEEVHTAFLSADDLHFCRSVFAGEPWQLSHVFGLDSAGAGVDAFFGQRGGVLVPRSYRILDTPHLQRTTK